MSSAPRCPVCPSLVASASLEAHLRQAHLGYASLRCQLCLREFFSPDDAAAHFAGRFASHPAQPPRLAEVRSPELDLRLADLLDSALGGAAQSCGACRCCQINAASPAAQAALAQPLPQPELEKSEEERLPKPIPVPSPEAELAAPPPPPPSLQKVKSEAAESQPEPRDVKPSLASHDGKVACLLCGHRVDRSNFGKHAQRSHVSVSPFLCNHCPFKSKNKLSVQKHLVTGHGLAREAEGGMTVLGLREEVARAVEECFGDVRAVALAKVLCRECRVAVPVGTKNLHASKVHLRQTVWECRLCPFVSTALPHGEVTKHLRAKHGRRLDETSAISHADRLGPVVKRMAQELYQQ